MSPKSETKRQTPAQDTIEVEEAKLRHEYLPASIKEIVRIMKTSKSEARRFAAATWIADKYFSRADKQAEAAMTAGKAAFTLAETLRDVLAAGGNKLEEAIDVGFEEIEREAGTPYVLTGDVDDRTG